MGTTAAETFESGTWAAATGGTTMLVDFVLPGEDGSLLSAVDAWDAKSKDRICVDIGYHCAIVDWNERIHNEMAEVVKRGINTFKHFMAYKGALMIDDDEMFASFRRCAALGAMPLVHAENGDVVAALQEKYMEEGLTGPEGHAHSRPPEVEGEAANRAAYDPPALENHTPWEELYRSHVGQLAEGGCLEFATRYRRVAAEPPRHSH